MYDVEDNASPIDNDDNCAGKDLHDYLFWSLQIHSPFTGTCSVVVKRGILNLLFFNKRGGCYLVSFDFDLYALIKFYYNFIKTVHKKEGRGANWANVLKFIFLLQALDVIIQCIIGLRVKVYRQVLPFLYISMYYFRIFFLYWTKVFRSEKGEVQPGWIKIISPCDKINYPG